MKNCFYYWLIEPIRDRFHDSPESVPVFEIPIYSQDKIYKLALFTDISGIPEYARLTIPSLQSDALPEDSLPLIQIVKEHLLSVLRLTYHSDARFFPRPIWMFIEENSPHNMELQLTQQIQKVLFNSENTRNMFTEGFLYREELRLLIDGQDSYIPLQYRYLSLYKILELHFKHGDNWLKNELDLILDRYEHRFQEIGIKQRPWAYLHQLRDKCAHIKKSGNKETLGVTLLRQKEAAAVEKIIPIFSEICIEVVNTLTKGSIKIGLLEN